MAKRKLVSLFTGAGGLDLGLEAAGFETAVAVEMDSDCVATLRHNRTWPVLDRDVHDVSSRELMAVGRFKEGEVHLLAGGPPCQPFTWILFVFRVNVICNAIIVDNRHAGFWGRCENISHSIL